MIFFDHSTLLPNHAVPEERFSYVDIVSATRQIDQLCILHAIGHIILRILALIHFHTLDNTVLP